MYFSDVQIRLIVLYTLKTFNISMTLENFQDVLVFDGPLDYFTLMHFLFDTQKLGLISTYELEGKTRYDITPHGEETLGLFVDKIPPAAIKHIGRAVAETRHNIDISQQINATVVPIDIGKFCAKCGIYERGLPLFEINFMAGGENEAALIAERFRSNAESLYADFVEKLLTDND